MTKQTLQTQMRVPWGSSTLYEAEFHTHCSWKENFRTYVVIGQSLFATVKGIYGISSGSILLLDEDQDKAVIYKHI